MLSWLTSRSKTSLPEPTALQAQKSRQIEQLKTFNQNVSEIQRDVEYRVNTAINGTTISFYVTLPPQFPQEKPIVKVTPRVSHPWVNDQMLVHGSPAINNFMVHSDLGKVIREVIEEFHKNPPRLLPSEYNLGSAFPHVTSPSVSSVGAGPANVMPHHTPYQYPPQSSSSSSSSSVSTGQQPSVPSYIASLPVSLPQGYVTPSTGTVPNATRPPNFGIPDLGTSVLAQDQSQTQMPISATISGYKMPDIPLAISQLSELSKQDLLELLDNEDKLLQVIEALPEVKKVACDREIFAEQNEQMARENLSLKPILEEKKKSLLEKFDVFNDVKSKYDENCHRQEEVRRRFDPRNIQDNIKVAALQAEETSETIAEGFLDGKISMDEFKRNFMEKRKLSHLRRAKEERLGQCLLNQSPGGY